ncbi:MAG: peptidoglycan DD-metalloendopeptidase family protein [Myxococcota bacterium]
MPLWLVLLLLIWPAGSPAQDEASRLENIRREIEQREARARDYRDEAAGLLDELDGIDRELSEVRRSVRVLRRHERAARQDLQSAQRRVAEARRLLDESRGRVDARLVSLYKFSATGGLRALYSARDFESFARGRRGLARVLEQDRELFARYRRAEETWRREGDTSRALVAELAGSRRELGRREDRVRQMMVERRNTIALLRSRSRDELRAVRELREAALRLERALEDMPRRYAGPGLERGTLAWPVDGPVRLAFGRQLDPEFGTETLRTGIEITADLGEPVRAVAGGRVLFAGWFRGFGQLVILDHGAGSVSVSGYLDELEAAAGDRVEEGQTIGRVGETGSVSGPGLYFEIRHESGPVDPTRWLKPR